jgi:hypothetical protein
MRLCPGTGVRPGACAYVPVCVRIMLKQKDYDSKKTDKNHEIFFSGLTVKSGLKNIFSKVCSNWNYLYICKN